MKTKEEGTPADILEEYTGLKSAVGHKTKFTLKEIYLEPTENIKDIQNETHLSLRTALGVDDAAQFLSDTHKTLNKSLKDWFKNIYFELQLDESTFYIEVPLDSFYYPNRTKLLFTESEMTDLNKVELIGHHLTGKLDESLEKFQQEQSEIENKYDVKFSLPKKEFYELSDSLALQKYLKRFIKFAQLYNTRSNSNDEPIKAQIEEIETVEEATARIVILLGDEKIKFEIKKSVLYRDYEFINSTGEGLLETAIGSKVLLLPQKLHTRDKGEKLYLDTENYWLLFSEKTYEASQENTQNPLTEDEDDDTRTISPQKQRNKRSLKLSIWCLVLTSAFFFLLKSFSSLQQGNFNSLFNIMLTLLQINLGVLVLSTAVLTAKVLR